MPGIIAKQIKAKIKDLCFIKILLSNRQSLKTARARRARFHNCSAGYLIIFPFLNFRLTLINAAGLKKNAQIFFDIRAFFYWDKS
jgi:hypothetical protein